MDRNCMNCKYKLERVSHPVCDACEYEGSLMGDNFTKWEPKDEVKILSRTELPVDTLLKERGSRYGKFEDNSYITQECESIFKLAPNYEKLFPIQKEAIHMILQKLSRAACGDGSYSDNWEDVCGYSQCVVNWMREHDND